ncbi:hypothetical protein ACDZ94_26830 (plasmid) [Pseudomonas sp. UBT]|uniref:hypothetical protein n=1 Tax=Pseudomonas sp. UBT TaxID=3239198 RepID=UPI003D800CBB
MSNSFQDAATLVYKAMAIHSSPHNDPVYRQLLARCRAERDFAETVQGVAEGMSLIVLDISDRGLVIAPSGKDSRFSIRMSDFRSKMSEEQKVAMLLAHLAIGAVFYPTSDFLDDEGRTPFPATLGIVRDKLLSVAKGLAKNAEGDSYAAEENRSGWEYMLSLPVKIPNSERASLSSIEGIITVCLNRMLEYGLVRKEGREDIDEQTSFTPTHQLRIQLRELTLPTLFKAVVEAAASKVEG